MVDIFDRGSERVWSNLRSLFLTFILPVAKKLMKEKQLSNDILVAIGIS